jgi:hypothetical protein
MDSAPLVLSQRRPVPVWVIVLLALAVHGPLLLMQLPASSYDANFHMFFARHYAQHWFDPWNTKWFAGFSQTTYPPLPQQWMALLSHVFGLQLSYMIVQLAAVLLLPIGVYRYAKIWVDERSASFAAIGSVFLGSLAMLVYQAGQLGTTSAAALYLNAIPYFYEWSRGGRTRSLIKGLALALAAAAAHHVTLIFGSVLFILPVLWLACMDRNEDKEQSVVPVIARAAIFGAIAMVTIGIMLSPYFIALKHNPITQMPIPHASRTNLLMNSEWGINYGLIPYGALWIAFPFVVLRAAKDRRLIPLLLGFWLTFLFGLGGTTPIPRILLGRAFEVLTFERFSFWATLMMLPIVGLLANQLIERYRKPAAIGLWLAAVVTCGAAIGWTGHRAAIAPDAQLDVKPVIDFLNRGDNAQYRYLTLGFGSQLAKVGTYTDAGTVDGDYNSARTLPEMTKYGAAQLTNSKYYGIAGMESLRAMLRHADRYGIKWIFIRDRYYEPIVQFAGWRKIDAFNNGIITVWAKDDVPPATKIESNAIPPRWQGIFWGIFPFGSSVLALLLVLLMPDRRRAPAETYEFPARRPHVAVQEVAR